MEIAKTITELLKEFLNLKQHRGGPSLNPLHTQKITDAIVKKESLTFVLPAFPAKSPNREKTLGDLPDLGELLALKRLNELCQDIGRVYSAGAKVIICSDGRVFSDLVLVSDDTISNYTIAIEALIALENLEFLSVFHLDHALVSTGAGVRPESLREELLTQFAESKEAIVERTRTQPAAKQLFNGMHRFIFEDRLVFHGTSKSREKIKQESKDVAYELIRRSNAWSALLEQQFPKAVRLSIHPQAWDSEKIPVRLLPSEDRWRTPWHSVALVQGNDVRLVPRKVAQESGARLYYYQGRYPYFGFNCFQTEERHADLSS